MLPRQLLFYAEKEEWLAVETEEEVAKLINAP
jgi:hypothetical protein